MEFTTPGYSLIAELPKEGINLSRYYYQGWLRTHLILIDPNLSSEELVKISDVLANINLLGCQYSKQIKSRVEKYQKKLPKYFPV